MSKTFHFQIATPERVVFSAAAVESVTLPTQMGEITVLAEHIPLVANLVPGEIKVVVGGADVTMAVSGGFINVQPGKVVVLADTAEHAEEINIERAEQARERAGELMRQQRTAETTDYTALAARLEKELARVKVARKHRERKGVSIKVEE
ncbi:MAG: ATP synthase F1 subunit epsilon [Patescibacteria group bacterium]